MKLSRTSQSYALNMSITHIGTYIASNFNPHYHSNLTQVTKLYIYIYISYIIDFLPYRILSLSRNAFTWPLLSYLVLLKTPHLPQLTVVPTFVYDAFQSPIQSLTLQNYHMSLKLIIFNLFFTTRAGKDLVLWSYIIPLTWLWPVSFCVFST